MEIKYDKLYSVKEVAEYLWFTTTSIRIKCKRWDIKSSNIKSWPNDIYRISGESILNFLNK